MVSYLFVVDAISFQMFLLIKFGVDHLLQRMVRYSSPVVDVNNYELLPDELFSLL
jgi:hypothetical protein